jgi:hypothetical protein
LCGLKRNAGDVTGTVMVDDAVAVYVSELGFVSPPPLVVEIVTGDVVAALYTNVALVPVPIASDTLVGVNVPPAPPSEGVTVTAAARLPFDVTVKLVEFVPTAPVLGPVSVYAVAVVVAVYVIVAGFVSD